MAQPAELPLERFLSLPQCAQLSFAWSSLHHGGSGSRTAVIEAVAPLQCCRLPIPILCFLLTCIDNRPRNPASPFATPTTASLEGSSWDDRLAAARCLGRHAAANGPMVLRCNVGMAISALADPVETSKRPAAEECLRHLLESVATEIPDLDRRGPGAGQSRKLGSLLNGELKGEVPSKKGADAVPVSAQALSVTLTWRLTTWLSQSPLSDDREETLALRKRALSLVAGLHTQWMSHADIVKNVLSAARLIVSNPTNAAAVDLVSDAMELFAFVGVSRSADVVRHIVDRGDGGSLTEEAAGLLGGLAVRDAAAPPSTGTEAASASVSDSRRGLDALLVLEESLWAFGFEAAASPSVLGRISRIFRRTNQPHADPVAAGAHEDPRVTAQAVAAHCLVEPRHAYYVGYRVRNCVVHGHESRLLALVRNGQIDSFVALLASSTVCTTAKEMLVGALRLCLGHATAEIATAAVAALVRSLDCIAHALVQGTEPSPPAASAAALLCQMVLAVASSAPLDHTSKPIPDDVAVRLTESLLAEDIFSQLTKLIVALADRERGATDTNRPISQAASKDACAAFRALLEQRAARRWLLVEQPAALIGLLRPSLPPEVVTDLWCTALGGVPELSTSEREGVALISGMWNEVLEGGRSCPRVWNALFAATSAVARAPTRHHRRVLQHVLARGRGDIVFACLMDRCSLGEQPPMDYPSDAPFSPRAAAESTGAPAGASDLLRCRLDAFVAYCGLVESNAALEMHLVSSGKEPHARDTFLEAMFTGLGPADQRELSSAITSMLFAPSGSGSGLETLNSHLFVGPLLKGVVRRARESETAEERQQVLQSANGFLQKLGTALRWSPETRWLLCTSKSFEDFAAFDIFEPLLALAEISEPNESATHCIILTLRYSLRVETLKTLMRWAFLPPRDPSPARSSMLAPLSCDSVPRKSLATLRARRIALVADIVSGAVEHSSPMHPSTVFVSAHGMGEPGISGRLAVPEIAKQGGGLTVMAWVAVDATAVLQRETALLRLRTPDCDLDIYLSRGHLCIRSGHPSRRGAVPVATVARLQAGDFDQDAVSDAVGTQNARAQGKDNDGGALEAEDGVVQVCTSLSLPAAKWHHLALVQDEAGMLRSPTTRLLLDGQQVYSSSKFHTFSFSGSSAASPASFAFGAADDELGLAGFTGHATNMCVLRRAVDTSSIAMIAELGCSENFLLLRQNYVRSQYVPLVEPSLRLSVAFGADPRFTDGCGRCHSTIPHVLLANNRALQLEPGVSDVRLRSGSVVAHVTPPIDALMALGIIRNFVVPAVALCTGAHLHNGAFHSGPAPEASLAADTLQRVFRLVEGVASRSGVADEVHACSAFYTVGHLLTATPRTAELIAAELPVQLFNICLQMQSRSRAFAQAARSFFLHPRLWPCASPEACVMALKSFTKMCEVSAQARQRLSELGAGRMWARRLLEPAAVTSLLVRQAIADFVVTVWHGSFGESDARQVLSLLDRIARRVRRADSRRHASPGRSERIAKEADANEKVDGMTRRLAATVHGFQLLTGVLLNAPANAVELVGARGGMKPLLSIMSSAHGETNAARCTAVKLSAHVIRGSREVQNLLAPSSGGNAEGAEGDARGASAKRADLSPLHEALRAHQIDEEAYSALVDASLTDGKLTIASYVAVAWSLALATKDAALCLKALHDAGALADHSAGGIAMGVRGWHRLLPELALRASEDGWTQEIERATLAAIVPCAVYSIGRAPHAVDWIEEIASCFASYAMPGTSSPTQAVPARFIEKVLAAWCASTRSTSHRATTGHPQQLPARETQNLCGVLYLAEAEIFHRAVDESTAEAVPSSYSEDAFSTLRNQPESLLGLAHGDLASTVVATFAAAPSLLVASSPPARHGVTPGADGGDGTQTFGRIISVPRPGGLRRILIRILRAAVRATAAQPRLERTLYSPAMTLARELSPGSGKDSGMSVVSSVTSKLTALTRSDTEADPHDLAEANATVSTLAVLAVIDSLLEGVATVASGRANPSDPSSKVRGLCVLNALKHFVAVHRGQIEALIREAKPEGARAVKKMHKSFNGRSFVDGVAWLSEPNFNDFREFVDKVMVLSDMKVLRREAAAAASKLIVLDNSVHGDATDRMAAARKGRHDRATAEKVEGSMHTSVVHAALEHQHSSREDHLPMSSDSDNETQHQLVSSSGGDDDEPNEGALQPSEAELQAERQGALRRASSAYAEGMGQLQESAFEMADRRRAGMPGLSLLSNAEQDIADTARRDAAQFAAQARGRAWDTHNMADGFPFARLSPVETLRGLCTRLEPNPDGTVYEGLAPKRPSAADVAAGGAAKAKAPAVRKGEGHMNGESSDDEDPDVFDDDAAANDEDEEMSANAPSVSGDVSEACELVYYMECRSARIDLTAQDLTLSLEATNTCYNQIVGADAKQYMPVPGWRTLARPLADISEVAHKRRFRMSYTALELRFHDRTSLLVNFPTKASMERVVGHLARRLRRSRASFVNPDGRAALKAAATRKWVSGEMSNLEYLLHLNFHSGRSVNDMTQYPVVPWVLSDYTSPTIDLADSRVYRDLRAPVGLLGDRARREAEVETRFADLEELDQVGFHYFTHYSSPATVMHYLVRLEPFTAMHVVLQGGRFDHADRMFHSVASSWASICKNHQDVKELVPELFAMPEVLTNCNRLEFGVKQDGIVMEDVVLPPWAQGDARRFVQMMREALESELVATELHHWIDLIFGYRQRGKHAKEALNLFHPHTYEPSKRERAAFDAMPDDERKRLIDSLDNIGQCPVQVFTRRHPSRQPLRYANPIEERNVVLRHVSVDWAFTRVALMRFTDGGKLIAVGSSGAVMCFDTIVSAATRTHAPSDKATDRSTSGTTAANSEYQPSLVGRLMGSRAVLSLEVETRCPPLARGAVAFPHDSAACIVDPTVAGGTINRAGSTAVLASDDGRSIYIAYAGVFDNCCLLRNVRTRTELPLSLHRGRATCVAATPRGTFLAVGCSDTTMTVFRVELRPETIRVTPHISVDDHESVVLAAACCDVNDMVISGGTDGSVWAHSLASGARLFHRWHPEGRPVDSILLQRTAYLPAVCVASSSDASVHMWSINGEPLRRVELSAPLQHWAMTADPRYCVVATTDGAVTFRHALDLAVVVDVSGGNSTSSAAKPDVNAALPSATASIATAAHGNLQTEGRPVPSATPSLRRPAESSGAQESKAGHQLTCVVAHPRYSQVTVGAVSAGLTVFSAA